MSQENVDRLLAGYDYTNRTGEFDPEAVHPDMVLDISTFRGAIEPGPYQGVDEANAFLARWLDAFENWSMEVEEFFDSGDRVITILRQHGQPKHGGPDVEMRVAHVWTFRDGLVARMEMYASREEAWKLPGCGSRRAPLLGGPAPAHSAV